ncbi:hypothetical protein NFI96_006778 [Prochilodus magdalenae]|nr:hypothetical protein NFI96_006778 [Prochilodus magdalenae]
MARGPEWKECHSQGIFSPSTSSVSRTRSEKTELNSVAPLGTLWGRHMGTRLKAPGRDWEERLSGSERPLLNGVCSQDRKREALCAERF